jgi:hypothetical protein
MSRKNLMALKATAIHSALESGEIVNTFRLTRNMIGMIQGQQQQCDQ